MTNPGQEEQEFDIDWDTTLAQLGVTNGFFLLAEYSPWHIVEHLATGDFGDGTVEAITLGDLRDCLADYDIDLNIEQTAYGK